jgi:hypothetical protein
MAQHGKQDVWSSPLATFASGRGDCEDYAIAKYVALLETGFPVDDLRVTVVHDVRVRADHAVLTARLDGYWIVMDNIRTSLLEDRDVTWQYRPIAAFGSDAGPVLAASIARAHIPVEPELTITSFDFASAPRVAPVGLTSSEPQVASFASLPVFLAGIIEALPDRMKLAYAGM